MAFYHGREMDKNPLLDKEFSLVAATQSDVIDLYSWFSDQHSISRWGGPGFEYPMSQSAFLSALRVEELASYWVEDSMGQKVAFGQFYERLGRHHLGRLVVAEHQRGRGLGKQLVLLLLERSLQSLDIDVEQQEASLFVMQDNPAAIQCYQSLGFTNATYPGGIPGNMSNCDYMIKPLR